MILEAGEKIHVMIRRGFETDLRRHFIGEVLEVTDGLARVEGYVHVLDTVSNQYVRRPDKRLRIVSLADSGNIVNILPSAANLEQTKYVLSSEDRLVLTDGKTFTLDINEFGASR